MDILSVGENVIDFLPGGDETAAAMPMRARSDGGCGKKLRFRRKMIIFADKTRKNVLQL